MGKFTAEGLGRNWRDAHWIFVLLLPFLPMLSLELLLEVLSLLLLLMRTSHYQHRRSGGKSNGQLAINVQLDQLARFVLFRIKINKRINSQCAKKSLDRTNCAHDIFHCQQINERPWYIARSLNMSTLEIFPWPIVSALELSMTNCIGR